MRDLLGVGPVRLLGGGPRQRLVETGTQVRGQRRQLGQHFDGGVDRPVHVRQVKPSRKGDGARPDPSQATVRPDTAGGRLLRPGAVVTRTDRFHIGRRVYSPRMATLLWILAVVLVVAGIVAIVRRQLLWGIVLIIVGLLVGPGGVSIFT
ncbi:hypothetical protein GCM10023403_43290 [Pseudonocardia benzenivorans]|nr:hypothetical protein PSD17_46150 [Pseudonocardia sp. D17]